MPIEFLRGDAMKLLEPMFSITPEALDAVDMTGAAHELILPVVDSVVLTVADIDESVVATPAVRVDDDLRGDAPTDNGL